ncbi:hypothetical protein HELRODRAFT_174329 [Helobdella robusta]|uniref:Uncharacterized protein n=1 Tax=Helobdella robusta TaxID=6412 RepID=T1F808_HELRO|nr:hypothetical protein HELRODRAFT_174329 [Helobdella robusta]ESO02887.1 hypothetical protein HELRODRAFT_174329 [Helobdella robusta]
MASKAIVVNELLYFLTNNLGLLDNDAFVYNVSEFYSRKEFVCSLECLKSVVELYKSEIENKNDKLILHGTTEKNKLLDCLAALKCLESNNFLEKFPVFVSKDLTRVHRLENVIKVCMPNTLESCKNNYYRWTPSISKYSSVRRINKNINSNSKAIKTLTFNIKLPWADRDTNDAQNDDNQTDDNFTVAKTSAAFRILFLGADFDKCACGARVDQLGYQSLSCRLGPGRQARHTAINEYLVRCFQKASIPVINNLWV